jgi:outer membrane protein assembly factor BamB
MLRIVQQVLVSSALLAFGCAVITAEDWPEFRGKGRLGVWNETGILETFPSEGLKIRWRTPIRAGYAGPAVADGRVFVADFLETGRLRGTERAIALDEKTGKILWTHEWQAAYPGMLYAYGPKATPTVDGNRVYILGADGKLFCFDVKTGAVIWQKDFVADLGAAPDKWAYYYGFASAPIVDGARVVCIVGGKDNAFVVAFDKTTGAEVWRALSSDLEPGVAQPIIITAGGARQLIIWHPSAVVSINPESGRKYWEVPFKAGGSMTVATPIHKGSLLFVTNFYNGGLMLKLDEKKPGASVLWKGTSDSEIQTEGLHATTATPVIIGDHLYGICSYGQFRCLLKNSGARVWETQALTKERSRWASGQIVQHGDRLFVNNDRGELVIVKPSPDGYEEIGRTHLIKPTTLPGNRRQLEYVNWSHPAYANRHIFARNDEEIICASLAADGQ